MIKFLSQISVMCNFGRMNMPKRKKTTQNYDNFLEQNDITEPMNPRDALYGGRTNAIRLHYKCEENEKAKYIDYTSLNPFVMKYCEYPIGSPEIITDNIDPERNYFSIMKCKVFAKTGTWCTLEQDEAKKKDIKS